MKQLAAVLFCVLTMIFPTTTHTDNILPPNPVSSTLDTLLNPNKLLPLPPLPLPTLPLPLPLPSPDLPLPTLPASPTPPEATNGPVPAPTKTSAQPPKQRVHSPQRSNTGVSGASQPQAQPPRPPKTVVKFETRKVQDTNPKVIVRTVVKHDTTTETKFIRAGIGLGVLIGAAALCVVALWLGYILGYKDSDRESARFMAALRDQFVRKR